MILRTVSESSTIITLMGASPAIASWTRMREQAEQVFEKRLATPKSYDLIVEAVASLSREAGAGPIGIGAPGSSASFSRVRRASLAFTQ